MKKLTKGQINLLISAISYSVGVKSFGVLSSARPETLNPLLENGLLQHNGRPGNSFVEITPAGVDALRGLLYEEYDLPKLIDCWDREAKASVIVNKIESIHADAYRALSLQAEWPKACSIAKQSSSWFYRSTARPGRHVERVLASIGEAKAKLPEDILKLRRQLLDLEDLLDGVNKIDEELRALGVKASDVSDNGGNDGTND